MVLEFEIKRRTERKGIVQFDIYRKGLYVGVFVLDNQYDSLEDKYTFMTIV